MLKFIKLGLANKPYQCLPQKKTNNFVLRSFSSSVIVKEKIGFVGLGQMGFHMANNLYNKTDFPFTVYDNNQKNLNRFMEGKDTKKRPLNIASSPEDLAKNSTIVITMLPESKHVKEVYYGEKGLYKGATSGTLFIDSSTIDPIVSKEIAGKMEESNFRVVDAPVSGGILGAEAGTLTFMVGASSPTNFEAAKTILTHMGKAIVSCGANGNGQVAKICNNMLLGIGMLGTAEAMNLGQKMGMDPKLLASILNTSSGRCWSSDTYNPCPGVMENVPASRNYAGGFGISLMAKDMGLALNAANSVKANVMLGALSQQVYNMVSKTEGFENKDFGSVYKWMGGKPVDTKK